MRGDFWALFLGGVGECIMRQKIQYFIVSTSLYKYNIGVQNNFITLNGIDTFHQQINTNINKNII
jgi:hypothetical protein